MAAKIDDSRPAYLQVADDLREQIANGELAPGARVRTNEQLAEDYEVAPMTVRSALDVLRGEGLIVSQRGRGTFVATNPEPAGKPDVRQQVADLAAEVQRLKRRVSILERQGSSGSWHASDDA